MKRLPTLLYSEGWLVARDALVEGTEYLSDLTGGIQWSSDQKAAMRTDNHEEALVWLDTTYADLAHRE